ncbi:metal ABC transporter permease [Brevibacterium pityocampae]|uniref:ABC transporter domain-containing protein n=1 Tax=Brevibacterium pityocampae TaxID=506594 RepID=A0ABP8JJJ6_9MICO
MEWFTEPFALGFQQRALIGGLISAVMASVVGVWLVLRGMSFFGDAFAHGILPGIAVAMLLDVSPALGAAAAIVAMVLLIEWIHRATPLHEDTGIGLLFVAMMALGVVIISTMDQYTGSLTGILFGDALGVTPEVLRGMFVPAVAVLLASAILYRPLLSLAFSQSKAQSLGMRPGIIHVLLLVLIAAAVIVGFRSVGTMLVFGLLVGPPATASLLSRTVPQMFAWSTLIAVFSVWAGLLLSFHLGTAGSATMALVPIALFFLTLIIRQLDQAVRHRTVGRGEPSAGSADSVLAPGSAPERRAPGASVLDPHSGTAAAGPAAVPATGSREDPGGDRAGHGTGHGVAGRRAPDSRLHESFTDPEHVLTPAEVPLAEAEGIVLAYGQHIATARSTFTLRQGDVVAIIGPNGSGKSTLLHAIAGLMPPRAGRLRVLGAKPALGWRKVAYVMQAVEVPAGIPLTVREVVAMGRYSTLGWFRPFRRHDRQRVQQAMEALGITDLARRHLSELSGGQRQRVYVAQALAQDHIALLLDEPLTGLDIVSARTIDRIIHAEHEHGHSVVMTTHDLEEARAADHVLLTSGRVLASGPPEQALTRRNLEVAYGLGSLHGDEDPDTELPEVLPDPVHGLHDDPSDPTAR